MSIDLVNDTYDRWRRLLLEATPTDRQRAADAVRALYRLNGLAEPQIIRCRNPFEMTVLPLLLAAVLEDSIWTGIAKELYKHQGTKKFSKALASQWQKLSAQMLNPMLSEYVRRLPDPERYAHCVPPLLETMKLELVSYATGTGTPVRERAAEYAQNPAEEWLRAAFSDVSDRWGGLYDAYCETGRSHQERLDQDRFQDWRQLQSVAPHFEWALRSIAETLSTAAEVRPRAMVVVPQVLADVINLLHLSEGGQAQIRLLGTTFFEDLCENDLIWPWLELSQSCCAISCGTRLCLVCDKPLGISLNEHGDLHNTSGPAITFDGGFEAYAWNGTIIPGDIIITPDAVTIERINSEPNLEVRRAMIDIYGVGQYLIDSAAEVIHRDEYGVLYRQNSIVVVEVINSTAEPDGSNRRYFLKVPPHIKRAKQAVAWTFGLSEEEYDPTSQT